MAKIGRIKIKVWQIKEAISSGPLARNRLSILSWRVFQSMIADDATLLAAGVAYYAIFSLFPLLLGFFFVLGTVLDSENLQRSFLGFVTEYLPGSAEFVASNVREIVRLRGAFGIVALLSLFWTASAVFSAMSRAVNRAWNVQEDRPFYIAKPRQIGMALAVGVLFFLSITASSGIQIITHRDLGLPAQHFFLRELGLANLALRIFPWLITIGVFLLIYRFVPNCKTYWRCIWPGAVVAALLFELGKSLFVWYLESFATYSQVYGNVASVMVLLFWAYVSSLILILGAEISSEYARLYHPGRRPGAQRYDPLEPSDSTATPDEVSFQI